MEALGGAASIAGLFQAVLASYSFWDQCRKYGSESNIVLNMLKIEEARFKLWGEKWNLESGSGQKFFQNFTDQPHVVAVVRLNLEQLKLLFERAKKWEKRLEEAGTSKDKSQPEAGEKAAGKNAGGFSFKSIFKSSSNREHQRTNSTMNSVKWALPGGKQEFENLIINIRETTNTLCDITNYQVLEELMSAVVFSKARSLQEAFEIGEATADAKSLLQMVADMRAKVIEIDLIISKSAYYFEPERLYPRQGSRKQLNEWRSATNEQYDRFDRWQEHVSKEFWEQTVAKRLSSNGVDVQQQYKHGHEVAQYERSLILRRWVEDTTIFWGGRSGLSSERLSEIREGHRQCIAAVASQLHHIHRTQWTSGLEPKWIRTLDCAGYFYEELATEKYDRFSYAFLLPSHLQTAESVTCLTFTDCLLKLQKPPTLDIQKKLATALARTVFGVQLAGLLHKSFNPDNIIFFARNGDVEEATILAFLSEPYVVGFELARPDHRPDFSLVPAEVNLYTHPAYSVKRHFMPSFDVHSLGLILLSIGLWRPLESLWGEFIAYCDQQRKSRPETKVFLPGRATPGDLRKYSSNFEDDMFEHSLERFRNLDYQGWCLKAKEYSHPNEFERVKESAEWADAVRWCIKTAQEKEYSVKALFERVVQVFDEPDP